MCTIGPLWPQCYQARHLCRDPAGECFGFASHHTSSLPCTAVHMPLSMAGLTAGSAWRANMQNWQGRPLPTLPRNCARPLYSCSCVYKGERLGAHATCHSIQNSEAFC